MAFDLQVFGTAQQIVGDHATKQFGNHPQNK
jgi:hypothetical protein